MLNAISFLTKGLIIMVIVMNPQPSMKINLLPKISAIRPQKRRKQPNVSEYADTIH